MELEIRDEFIKLGQALKLAGIASSGIETREEAQRRRHSLRRGQYLHSSGIGVIRLYGY